MKSIGLKVCVSALAISVLLLSPAFAKCEQGSYFDQGQNRCLQDCYGPLLSLTPSCSKAGLIHCSNRPRAYDKKRLIFGSSWRGLNGLVT